MKRIAMIAVALTATAMTAFAQLNQVNRIPTVGTDKNQTTLTETETGFWIASEISGGYTLRIDKPNMPFSEFDVAGGYRFSQYLKVGIGAGFRYYIHNNDRVRRHHDRWVFPVYATVRGNMINEAYRPVVPYWSLDLGGAFRDGFMARPTVGLRFGESRHAFTLGISYLGQSMASLGCRKVADRPGQFEVYKKQRFVSGVALRFGFEY